MSEIQASKNALRTTMTQQLAALTPARRTALSLEIQQTFLSSEYFKNANSLLIYHADSSEVDTDLIIQACLTAGKKTALPRTQSKDRSMKALTIQALETDSEISRFGFREPRLSCPEIAPHHLDVILVPGRAFDQSFNRLGRGAGYYDRFLERVSEKAIVLGLAFEFQIVTTLPIEAHDRKPNGIVSGKSLFKNKS